MPERWSSITCSRMAEGNAGYFSSRSISTVRRGTQSPGGKSSGTRLKWNAGQGAKGFPLLLILAASSLDVPRIIFLARSQLVQKIRICRSLPRFRSRAESRRTLVRSSFHVVKPLLEGAAPRLIRPMYARANMGHPSCYFGFAGGLTVAGGIVVSHISRKTSEMWGTRHSLLPPHRRRTVNPFS